MSTENKTEHLKLPQYKPTDVFDLKEVNDGYKEIDRSYKEINDNYNKAIQESTINGSIDNLELIDARGGEAKLKDRLNNFDSSLETKANEIEVRKKNVLISEFDITDTLKQQINGNAPILQTIADGIITEEKTSFLKRGKNLFDKSTVVKGYYVNWADGSLIQNAAYNVTDFILLTDSEIYSYNVLGTVKVAFYDITKKYISGIQTPVTPITKPSNAKYLRISFSVNGEDSLQVEEGSQKTTYEKYLGYSLNGNKIKDNSIPISKITGLDSIKGYSKEEMIVELKTDEIVFYIKGTNDSSKYLKYKLKRTTVPFDGVSAVSNVDDWSIYEVWQVTRTGEYTFTNDYSESVVNVGAWEMAIKEKGASDFMGGYAHGDEVLTSAFLQIDGVTKTLGSDVGFLKCKNIRFVQKSDLFRCLTQIKVGEHLKKYDITSEGVKLNQEVKFTQSIVLDTGSYMPMLPIKRNLLNSPFTQITDRFYRDSDYIVNDVSTPEKVVSNGCMVNKVGVKLANISGVTSKISAEIEILNVKITDSYNMFLSNSSSYNKFYFPICGGDYTTAKDEIFKVECAFRINIGN